MTVTGFNQARQLRDVPLWIRLSLVLTLIAQLLWHSSLSQNVVQAEALPQPLNVQGYQLLSLNEPLAMARYLNLWLQSFDTQPGISLSFQQLDYARIIQWLDTIQALDTDSQYPMLVAAHIYGSVHNSARKRQMMEYIYEKFKQQPEKNWRWLAHAVIVARHELKEKALALEYAETLANRTKSMPEVPYWVKDMKIFVLEDMGELEAARVLVGGLLESGTIKDPYELNFLQEKIEYLEEKLMKPRQDVEISTDKGG